MVAFLFSAPDPASACSVFAEEVVCVEQGPRFISFELGNQVEALLKAERVADGSSSETIFRIGDAKVLFRKFGGPTGSYFVSIEDAKRPLEVPSHSLRLDAVPRILSFQRQAGELGGCDFWEGTSLLVGGPDRVRQGSFGLIEGYYGAEKVLREYWEGRVTALQAKESIQALGVSFSSQIVEKLEEHKQANRKLRFAEFSLLGEIRDASPSRMKQAPSRFKMNGELFLEKRVECLKYISKRDYKEPISLWERLRRFLVGHVSPQDMEREILKK